eukprot:15325758-Alexandrium_andersonii.AAC.1
MPSLALRAIAACSSVRGSVSVLPLHVAWLAWHALSIGSSGSSRQRSRLGSGCASCRKCTWGHCGRARPPGRVHVA